MTTAKCVWAQTITRLAFSQVSQTISSWGNNGHLRGLCSSPPFFPKFDRISRVYAPFVGDSISDEFAGAEPLAHGPRSHAPDGRKLLRSEGPVILARR